MIAGEVADLDANLPLTSNSGMLNVSAGVIGDSDGDDGME